MTLTLMELRQTGPMTWDVILGEGDHSLNIADAVEEMFISVSAIKEKQLPQVVLSLTLYPKFVAECEVVVDEPTHDCLLKLGWLPPRKPGESPYVAPSAVDEVFQAWTKHLVEKYGDKPVKDVIGSAMVMGDLVDRLAKSLPENTVEES